MIWWDKECGGFFPIWSLYFSAEVEMTCDLWYYLKEFTHCCQLGKMTGKIIHCSPSSGGCRPLIPVPNRQSPLETLYLDLNLRGVWSSSLNGVYGFVSDNTQTGPQILLLSSNKYFGRKAFLLSFECRSLCTETCCTHGFMEIMKIMQTNK